MTNILLCDVCANKIDPQENHYTLTVARTTQGTASLAAIIFHSHNNCYEKLQAWAAEQREASQNPEPEPETPPAE